MLSQTISLHTSPEHPVNFWFLSPSVTHMAETPSFDTLPWMLLSNKISHTLLHTITGRLLNCIAWSFFTIHIAIFFEETCPLASPPFYKSILPLLQNCSDSKVWVLLQVIKIVPVLIASVLVLAIHLDLYGFTQHQIACTEMWFKCLHMVPQDFSWHNASPSLLSDSLTSAFEVSQEKGAAGVSSCVTSSCYAGWEEVTGTVFMFHELYSSCLQDGSSEPALDFISLGVVRSPNTLGLNVGLGYVAVM